MLSPGVAVCVEKLAGSLGILHNAIGKHFLKYYTKNGAFFLLAEHVSNVYTEVMISRISIMFFNGRICRNSKGVIIIENSCKGYLYTI